MSSQTTQQTPIEQLSLVLPNDLFNELEQIAKREGISVVEAFRRIIKFGLFLDHISINSSLSLTLKDTSEDVEAVISVI